jgi:uncharacterized membrane protein
MEKFIEAIILVVIGVAVAMSVFPVILSSVSSAYNQTNATVFPNVGTLETIIPLVVIAGIILAVVLMFFKKD